MREKLKIPRKTNENEREELAGERTTIAAEDEHNEAGAEKTSGMQS